MRRLRRAHQRNVREQAKRRKKFRQRAVAAGTAAAITLGAGVGVNKALAAYTPDPHELAVSQDADADLLANKEELAIGYRVFKPDQNRNEIPDGVELAKRCATVIEELPYWNPNGGDPEPNEIYKIDGAQWGGESCDICGAGIDMGGIWIVNPKLHLTYPPGSLGEDNFLPYISLHYMEHGSFSFSGSIHNGRAKVARLLRVLELRFPYDPNDHQLPLDYVVDPNGQLAPDSNDLDGDLLADSEELEAGFNLYDPDQDDDLTPDGIELAKQCVEVIDGLSVYDPYSGDPEPAETYKVNNFQYGGELCDICGEGVDMGYWQIVNPKLGLSIDVYDIACHYMSHGSFSYFGRHINEPHDPFHNGRADIALLAEILEMPQRCGDLGTMYLPGDLNEDCKVDFADFANFSDRWLQSTAPNDDSVVEY